MFWNSRVKEARNKHLPDVLTTTDIKGNGSLGNCTIMCHAPKVKAWIDFGGVTYELGARNKHFIDV